MANRAQLQILKKGKEAWNQWREENTSVSPDLSGLQIDETFFENPTRTPDGLLDMTGINFADSNLEGACISDADLSSAAFGSSNMIDVVFTNLRLVDAALDSAVLSQGKFWNCDMHGASFWDGILENTVFSGANLHKVNFTNANMVHINLEGADLSEAELWRANMETGNLDGVKLNGANMQQCKLSKAILTRADLRGANLYEANLSEALLDEADVRFSDLRRANLSLASAAEIKYNKYSLYRGIRVSTCYGSPRFNRIANDQNYIEELRAQQWDPLSFFKDKKSQIKSNTKASVPIGEWLYWLWWFSSDCGRSLWRWALMSFFFAAMIGCVFYSLGEESFYIGTFNGVRPAWSLELMILYSLALFGKVSFGSITPITLVAERWAVVAGVAGLVMLGGLITILADKVARRA